jgi:hypothetical protein
MEKGIRFKSIWEDSDLLEIVLSAWNGEFGGMAKIYLGHGELREMAKFLQGFPQTNPDDRRFDLGDLNPDGLGGASLRFYMKDMAGHAAVEVSMIAGSHLPGDFQTVTLRAQIEAAAVDDFVMGLTKIENQLHSTAFLRIDR